MTTLPARTLVLAALCATLGCKQVHLGTCTSSSDCNPGSVCDTAASPAVCVIPDNSCVPLCTGGAVCIAGACLAGSDGGPDAGPHDGGTADVTPPTGTIGAVAGWHSVGEQVAVAGTLVDTGGSLTGGQTAVVLLNGTSTIATAVITLWAPGSTSATWAATVNLAVQGIATGFEGVFAFSARLTDAAGNVATVTGGAIQVDNRAPQFGSITLVTHDDDQLPDGGHLFLADGGPIAYSAQVSDSSGVAAVCARLSSESGGACPHPATTVDGGLWSFSLPRPGTATALDGTVATNWTLAADDALAAGLSGPAKVIHQASTPGDPLFFDNQPPAITIPADATWYARLLPGGAPALLTVPVTITDFSGLWGAASSSRPSIDKGPGGTPAFCTLSAGVYQCPLDLSAAAAGSEGNLAFAITATDHLMLSATVGGTRRVDDKPPVLSNLEIYRDSPSASGVIGYPANTTGTGWDGTTFVYSDVVRVTGVLTDNGAGLKGARARLHVDGIEVGGGNTTGTDLALGCADLPSCAFDVSVALNGTSTGAFHTGATTTSPQYPAGSMKAVVAFEDHPQIPGGGAATPNAGASTTPFHVTRLLWTASLPGITGIGGMAIHPDGDLIVTGNTTTTSDSVLALRQTNATSTAAVRWTWGATKSPASPFDNVTDAPALGAGSATSTLIYAASTSGQMAALTPDGAVSWITSVTSTNAEPFPTAPLIVQSSNGETAIVVGNAGTGSHIWNFNPTILGTTTTGSAQRRSSPDANTTSSPILALGSVWWGTKDNFLRRPLFANGSLDSRVLTVVGAGSASGGYWSPVSDGTSVWASSWSAGFTSSTILMMDGNTDPNNGIDPTTVATLANGVSGDMTFDASGNLWFGGWPLTLDKVNATSTAVTPTLVAISTNAFYTPLQATDGNGRLRIYAPRRSGLLNVYSSAGVIEWGYDPTPAMFRAVAMDCQGRLYVGIGDPGGPQAISAFVTDDKGLADTPWPSGRRDARNSGNQTAAKYGIRSGGVCAQ